MRTSCIAHPANDYYLQIFEWQLALCEGDATRAALLSFFEHWHNVRLAMQPQEDHQRTTATQHGDDPGLDIGLWQWHTMEKIERALLGIAKEDTIRKAIQWHKDQGFLQTGSNPDPRYGYDRTTFYRFCPEVVQQALDELVASGYQSQKHRANPRGCTYPKNREWNPEKSGMDTRKIGEQYSSSTSSSTETTTTPPLPPSLPEGGEVVEVVSDEKPPPEKPLTPTLTPTAWVDLYNAQATRMEFLPLETLSAARHRKLKRALRQYPELAFWEKVYQEVQQSAFLRGELSSNGHGNFQMTADWLLNLGTYGTENYVKVHDGHYRDKPPTPQPYPGHAGHKIKHYPAGPYCATCQQEL